MKNRNATILTVTNAVKSILFVLALIVGLVLNCIPPLRPTVSETENRELNKFPTFTIEKLLSGEFFNKQSDDPNKVGLSQWFSDTFPFREQLITAYGGIEGMFGIQTNKIHGDVQTGDDIPDLPSKQEPSSSQSDSLQSSQDTSSLKSEDTVSEESVEPLPEAETFGGVLLSGNTAYELYNFNTSVANRYSAAISNAANRLGDSVKVYDIIAPTSVGITLPDSLKKSVNSSDQQKAINYMYGSMSDKVVTVDAFTSLNKHKKEYIYFRTDHHWTQLGAYYAYEQFMLTKKSAPVPLEQYTTMQFDGFLGTFYTSTKKSPALAEFPDSVVAYKPFNNAVMTVTNSKGKTFNYPIIQDTTTYPSNLKYSSTFIGSDNPYTVIVNNDLSDGSACVLVKESFGNAFAPLLIPHYQTVYVVDYRYYSGSLVELVQNDSVSDVIFLNNISATRASSLVGYLEKLINR